MFAIFLVLQPHNDFPEKQNSPERYGWCPKTRKTPQPRGVVFMRSEKWLAHNRNRTDVHLATKPRRFQYLICYCRGLVVISQGARWFDSGRVPGVFIIIIIFFPYWWLSYNKLFYLSMCQSPLASHFSFSKHQHWRTCIEDVPRTPILESRGGSSHSLWK